MNHKELVQSETLWQSILDLDGRLCPRGLKPTWITCFLHKQRARTMRNSCRMDVLGLEDTPVGDLKVVHEEFLEQLRRDPEQGWYESGLPWKGDHPALPSNEANSLKRLESLVQRLKKMERLDESDAIIQDQLKKGLLSMQLSHQASLCSTCLTTQLYASQPNQQR